MKKFTSATGETIRLIDTPKALQRALKGKQISEVQIRWGERDESGRVAYDPRITFTDGSWLCFEIIETDMGNGIELELYKCLSK